MDWKVYRTYLKQNYSFSFHVHNNKLLSVNDESCPIISTNDIWELSTNTITSDLSLDIPFRITISVFRVLTSEIDEYFKAKFPSFYDVNAIYNPICNIHLIIKDWGEYSEVGMCLFHGVSDYHDIELQNFVDRYHKLIIFK